MEEGEDRAPQPCSRPGIPDHPSRGARRFGRAHLGLDLGGREGPPVEGVVTKILDPWVHLCAAVGGAHPRSLNGLEDDFLRVDDGMGKAEPGIPQ